MRWPALDSESAPRIRHLCSPIHHSSLECALAGCVFFGVPGCRDRRNGTQPKPVQQVGPRPTLISRKSKRPTGLVRRCYGPPCTAPGLRTRASLSTRRPDLDSSDKSATSAALAEAKVKPGGSARPSEQLESSASPREPLASPSGLQFRPVPGSQHKTFVRAATEAAGSARPSEQLESSAQARETLASSSGQQFRPAQPSGRRLWRRGSARSSVHRRH